MRDALLHGRDLLLPPRCAGCGGGGAWFCLGCRDACEPAEVPLAARSRAAAAGAFEGPLREALHRYKYKGERALAGELGALVAGLVARDLARGRLVEAVVPVPLHPRRAAERGYDQAALLGSRVAARCGLPLVPALRRIRWARPQVELDRAARAENARAAFAGVAGALRGLRVALVDDVMTTGATMRDASRAARACGALKVHAYVVALDA